MPKQRLFLYTLLGLSAFGGAALSFVGFVTISETEKVQLTIYNSADLTLVRDTRRAVFKRGENALRYEWAGTRIDPTSLRPLLPQGLELLDTTYPLSHGEALVWKVKSDSETGANLPVQYFTSGLTWQASHLLKLGNSGRANLETWIKVKNNSGEPYGNANISLVVGEVKLVETIAELADRFRNEAERFDYAPEPEMNRRVMEEIDEVMMDKPMAAPAPPGGAYGGAFVTGVASEKMVERESLSELHLYRIEGTETVPNGGARRMRAFHYDDIKVKDVFRCHDPLSKQVATRVMTIENKEDNNMGKQPLPEGVLQVYRETENGLSYEGRGDQEYTPMDETSETPLGSDPRVSCQMFALGMKKHNLEKNALGQIKGWDETLDSRLKLVNGSGESANFEVRLDLPGKFKHTLKGGENEDRDTLLYKTTLGPFESKSVDYTLTVPKGTRAENK